MADMQLISANCYRRREAFIQTASVTRLALHVGGLDFMHVWLPDGRLLYSWDHDPGPCLLFRLPGTKVSFRYNAGRENWTIQMHLKNFQCDPASRTAIWEKDGLQHKIPFYLPLPPHELPGFQHQFANIRRLLKSNLPRHLAAAELQTYAILSRLLEDSENSTNDIVERFKQRIDADEEFEYSLEQIAAELGWSLAHLRRLFQTRYQLDPQQYRIGRRLRAIMEMISHTDYTLKEIAARTGMKNVTHLYLLLKKHYQMTPGDMIRQYRSVD